LYKKLFFSLIDLLDEIYCRKQLSNYLDNMAKMILAAGQLSGNLC